MLELWKSLSDDQVALVGCAAALTIAGTVMSLSYYIGRGRNSSADQNATKPVVFDSKIGRSRPAASPGVAADRRDAA
jgi:hypothetical protein